MNELQTFYHPMFGEFKVLIQNGKEYFPSSEVATTLGYTNPHKAVIDHCLEDGLTICEVTDALGRPQKKKFISEGNMYRLIIRSKLPEAARFERWVFDEVLPSIRKTGSYSTQQPKSQAELSLMMAQQLVDQERKMKELESGLNEANEKIDNVSNIMTLNPKEWRSEINKIINSIAFKKGGEASYKDIRNESYQLLEMRAKCDLERRLNNRKRNMAFEGASKSQIKNTNKMDVIESDRRLTEIYLSIVKEMAIKYQVKFSKQVANM